jgi:competence protein ComEC
MSEWNGQGMQYLDIHFLDVGHGDCTLIEFPGRLTMVDVNNCKTLDRESEAEIRKRYTKPAPNPFLAAALGPLGGPRTQPNYFQMLVEANEAERKLQEAKDKLTNPIDYLKARFPGKAIFRYIQTHPDIDHMAGLYRIFVEEKIPIVNFWDTSHCIEKDEVAMKTGAVNHDIRDWHTYKQLRKSATDPTVLRLTINAKGDFYTPDGIAVWHPFNHDQQNDSEANPNDLSYILQITVGKCNILLGGDAPIRAWESLYEGNKKTLPKINLLKAPHHGRKSGYHMESVKAMNSDITVVSVGELKAKDDASASYERFSDKGCYSTVDHGTILARCWVDGDVWLHDSEGKKFAGSWE